MTSADVQKKHKVMYVNCYLFDGFGIVNAHTQIRRMLAHSSACRYSISCVSLCPSSFQRFARLFYQSIKKKNKAATGKVKRIPCSYSIPYMHGVFASQKQQLPHHICGTIVNAHGSNGYWPCKYNHKSKYIKKNINHSQQQRQQQPNKRIKKNLLSGRLLLFYLFFITCTRCCLHMVSSVARSCCCRVLVVAVAATNAAATAVATRPRSSQHYNV